MTLRWSAAEGKSSIRVEDLSGRLKPAVAVTSGPRDVVAPAIGMSWGSYRMPGTQDITWAVGSKVTDWTIEVRYER